MNDKKETTIIRDIATVLEAENFFSTCFGHLEVLIKNGTIQSTIRFYREQSLKNAQFLRKYLNTFAGERTPEKSTCSQCKVLPESFSLEGALNLGLEIIDVAITHYRSIIKKIPASPEKETLERYLSEKLEQKKFFKREKQFDHIHSAGVVDSFCVPYLLSRLY